MTFQVAYYRDQELPALGLDWYDTTGAIVDFSSGWTFTVKLCATATPSTIVNQTAAATGAATLPNVTINWASADFASLTPETSYYVIVYARRGSDSKDRVFSPGDPPQIRIKTAPA